MFFWMTLATLMGIITFGTLREKTKDADYFVTPVYDALARNMRFQHEAATAHVYDKLADGVNLGSGTVTIIDDNGTMSADMRQRLPPEFKHTIGLSSTIHCLRRVTPDDANVPCNEPGAVIYLVTAGTVPLKYAGEAAMSIPKAIASATNNSRYIGLIAKATAPTTEVGQPQGVSYFILSGGYKPGSNLFIPNTVICNLTRAPKSSDPRNLMIAMTVVQGLTAGESLAAPNGAICPAGP